MKNKDLQFLNHNTIILCGSKSCCPVLTLIDDNVIIKDDIGGQIVINKEQANLISAAIKELECQ